MCRSCRRSEKARLARGRLAQRWAETGDWESGGGLGLPATCLSSAAPTRLQLSAVAVIPQAATVKDGEKSLAMSEESNCSSRGSSGTESKIH